MVGSEERKKSLLHLYHQSNQKEKRIHTHQKWMDLFHKLKIVSLHLEDIFKVPTVIPIKDNKLSKNIKQGFEQGFKPVIRWWNGVKQHTADVLRSGGPEALKRMQADDKLSRTLHQGMKNYKKDPGLGSEFNAAMDPKRQPGAGYLGNNNDATVKSLLQQGQDRYNNGGDSVQLTDKDLVRPSGPVMAAGSARRAMLAPPVPRLNLR